MSREKLATLLRGESGGFGFTIARRLTEQNNGMLRIFSEEGKGTRVELLFRGQEELPEIPQKPESDPT